MSSQWPSTLPADISPQNHIDAHDSVSHNQGQTPDMSLGYIDPLKHFGQDSLPRSPVPTRECLRYVVEFLLDVKNKPQASRDIKASVLLKRSDIKHNNINNVLSINATSGSPPIFVKKEIEKRDGAGKGCRYSWSLNHVAETKLGGMFPDLRPNLHLTLSDTTTGHLSSPVTWSVHPEHVEEDSRTSTFWQGDGLQASPLSSRIGALVPISRSKTPPNLPLQVDETESSIEASEVSHCMERQTNAPATDRDHTVYSGSFQLQQRSEIRQVGDVGKGTDKAASFEGEFSHHDEAGVGLSATSRAFKDGLATAPQQGSGIGDASRQTFERSHITDSLVDDTANKISNETASEARERLAVGIQSGDETRPSQKECSDLQNSCRSDDSNVQTSSFEDSLRSFSGLLQSVATRIEQCQPQALDIVVLLQGQKPRHSETAPASTLGFDDLHEALHQIRNMEELVSSNKARLKDLEELTTCVAKLDENTKTFLHDIQSECNGITHNIKVVKRDAEQRIKDVKQSLDEILARGQGNVTVTM